MAIQGDYLELADPGERPRHIPLAKARIQIGRSTTCEVPLGGIYVSRRHARLERDEHQQWRLIDLGSANGSFVNGQRIQVATLGSGDIVGIGNHCLILHTAARAAAAAVSTAAEMEIVPTDVTSKVIERVDTATSHSVPAQALTDLHEAGRRLGRSQDILSLLNSLAQEFRSLLQPRRIAVGREDGPKCEWPVVLDAQGRPTKALDLPHQLVPRVQALQSSIAVKWDALASADTSAAMHRPTDSMLFPIKAGDRRLGHVYVELGSAHPKAGEDAVQLLSLLTRQAALIWEHLELQAVRHASQELNRELSAARQIQLQLFPNQKRLDPRLDIAAENLPALGVSGDYYDFQLMDSDHVFFIVADVMGHGLPAALLMAGVQAVFRTGVRAGWDIGEMDRRIHDVVAVSGQGELFVTGLLGVCDLARSSLSFLMAGHPWPSILGAANPIERNDKACSLPWGLADQHTASPLEVPLKSPDWSIVAYTDGVAESLLPDGRPYSARRIVELHERHRNSPADEICEQILSDVLGTSDASMPQADDITLLVLRGANAPKLAQS